MSTNKNPTPNNGATIIWKDPEKEQFIILAKDVNIFSHSRFEIPKGNSGIDTVVSRLMNQQNLIQASVNIHGNTVVIDSNEPDNLLVIKTAPVQDRRNKNVPLHVADYSCKMIEECAEYTVEGLMRIKRTTATRFSGCYGSINGSFIASISENPRVLYISGHLDMNRGLLISSGYLSSALATPMSYLANAFPELVSNEFCTFGTTPMKFRFKIPTKCFDPDTKSGRVIMRCEFPRKPKDIGKFAIIGRLTSNP